MLVYFIEALDHQTYRLRKKAQLFNLQISSNVAEFLKRLRPQLKGTKLYEEDPVSVLHFLNHFRDACNSTEVHEEVVMCLFHHIVKKLPSPLLSARLSFKKYNSSRFHDKKSSFYFEVVNILLGHMPPITLSLVQ